jgi:multiple sugar transport system substrate-binding protein
MKEKRYGRRLVLLALALLLGWGLAAAGATGTSETKDMAALGPLKLFTDKPGWQKGWDAVFAAFKAKTGIDVEMTGFTEINTYIASVKTGIASKEGPDVFTWWSNYKIADLAKQALLSDLSSLYKPLGGKYNPGILNAFSYEGKIYGAPVLVASWIMFYNKPVFDRYNLKEPKTWDEFIALCDTLKSKGVTPIAFTIDGGWTSFFWLQQLLASNYPQAYKDICEGRKSWKSPEVTNTFRLWKDMMDRGYFTDPGISLGEELPSMFAKGQVGMTYCGDWFTAFFDQVGLQGGKDYSIFVIPPQVKGRPKTVIYEAGPICISANAEHKEAATRFMEFWLSDECQKIWSETMNFVSPNADVSGAHLDAVKQKISTDVFQDKNAELIVRFWEATLETITLPACALFDKFVLKPADYPAIIEELDKLSSDAWAKYRSQ